MTTLSDQLKELGTSPQGLTSTEAQLRLQQQGPNELVGHVQSRVLEFIKSFFNPLNLILLVAALASAFLKEMFDAILVAVMVILSSLLNSWQTYRAEKAAGKLKEKIAIEATVLRDGNWREIPRRELVVGDIIRLTAGDLVPADVRLIEAEDVHVQEAALTGESMPAEKIVTTGTQEPDSESPSLLFLGTSVLSGIATAVVYARGKDTAFGEILERLSERPLETEFEKGMHRFGMLILKTVFFLVLFVLVANLSAGRDAFESILFSVALAVGLTPEFLPMITTVTLSQGAVNMAKKKVIVKHLSAIQNLGSIDILCCDKTGTLTTGTMSLDASLNPQGTPSEMPLKMAHLIASFETGIKSPFNSAILNAKTDNLDGYTKTDEIPFDFNRRMLSVVVEKDKQHTLIAMGAPEAIAEICEATVEERMRNSEVTQSYSEKGLRLLAVGTKIVKGPLVTKEDERNLTLTGFLAFLDHPLKGVDADISALKRDGVEVKIITGDNEKVTGYICSQVGINPGAIVLGKSMDHLDEYALGKLAENTTVFARVTPMQKERIIRALKSRNHVVGYLGDGINDAPSLHTADVGISVSGAVDVAREASDIILLERSLIVLHAGIMAGRRSFGNVFKYLLMGTSSNFGNMMSMAVAAIFLPFLPMLPIQILINNFLYDIAQITIPTDNVDLAFIDGPQRWNIHLIRNFMVTIGPISSLFDFVTFFILLKVFHFDEVLFHTGWFVESLVTQSLVLFVIRTSGRPWTNRPSLPLTLTTLGVVTFALCLPYTPFAQRIGFKMLPMKFYIFLLVVVGLYLVIVEIVKHRLMKKTVSL